MARITIFTPSYNAAHTIERVYKSLKRQSYKDFEWIIWNDGSKDNTSEVVKKFLDEKEFPIYYYEEESNSGKHIIFNKGLDKAKGELILNLDADDALTDYALSSLIYYWDIIENKEEYAGIKSRTINGNDFSKINGRHFHDNKLYIDDSLYNFRYKMKLDKKEMHFLQRVDLAKEYRCPNVKGLHFYPEVIDQFEVSKKYKIRFLDMPTRIYYTDDSTLTKSTYKRYKENIYLWEYYINNVPKLWFYSFKTWLKSYIGYSRDSLYNKIKYKQSVKKVIKIRKKIIYTLFYPIGWLLYKLNK